MQAPSSSMVQLESWASNQAPLSEAERASVNGLADWIAQSGGAPRRKVNGAAAPSHASKVSIDEESSAHVEVDPTSSQPDASSSSSSSGLPTAPLADAPSYLSWFAQQQARIAASTQTGHASSLQDITRAAEQADALLDHLEGARIHIAELRAGARMVEEGTEGLREDAESMVERIDHLSQLADAIAVRLSYFAILPSSTSLLSSPSLSLVTTPDFLRTLERLDVALAFVGAHAHYRDAPLYKMRFEHCVVRAGTLIRMYAVGQLKALGQDVSTNLKEWEKSRYAKGKEKEFDADTHDMMILGDPHVSALLFDRFRQEGARLRPVLQELEKRASFNAPPAATDIESVVRGVVSLDVDKGKEVALDEKRKGREEGSGGDRSGKDVVEEAQHIFRAPEFASLLEECRTTYFDIRRMLLSSMIVNCVARIEVMAQHPGAETNASDSATPSTSRNVATSATARLVDRGMRFMTAINEAESSLYEGYFGMSAEDGHGVRALHGHLHALSAPLDERLRPRMASEAGLAGLPAATLRSLEAWRGYLVGFLG